jgi:hypothetical protein
MACVKFTKSYFVEKLQFEYLSRVLERKMSLREMNIGEMTPLLFVWFRVQKKLLVSQRRHIEGCAVLN